MPKRKNPSVRAASTSLSGEPSPRGAELEDLRSRTAELLAANELLENQIAERARADEAQGKFLSLAAHELRTPLTSLRGFAQLLLMRLDRGEILDPEGLRETLQAIDHQADKVIRVVSQFIDVSCLEAGRLAFEPRVTEIVGLLGRIFGAFPGVTLHASGEILAPVDPARLEQAVRTILESLIESGPPAAPVDVTLSRALGEVEVVIRRPRLTRPERFWGGMGLHLSRRIVELHGGQVETESAGEVGTRVVLRLPLERRR